MMPRSTDPTDEDLVTSARAGNRDAFAALIGRHAATTRVLCTRVLGSPFRAEDAVQEAAIGAMLGLDRLREPAKFGPWLAGASRPGFPWSG
jgi:RNA polymerase sigma-70 factor (ECF subfamily)